MAKDLKERVQGRLQELRRRLNGNPNRTDVSGALQQLSLMLSTGIAFPEALHILGTETEHPRLREVFDDIAEQVIRKGWSFSSAAARHPEVFTDGTILMFRAGEESGDFAARLWRASELLDRKQHLIGQVKSALTGPMINASACILVTLGLSRMVLPKFVGLYDSMQIELPVISKVVIAGIHIINSPWTLVFLILSALLTFIFWNEVREVLFDRALETKWTRKLIGNILCVDFLDVMAAIHRDGIAITRGLDMLEATAPFKTYRRDLAEVSVRLHELGSLSEAISAVPYFPPIVESMLLVGEQVGQMSESLQQTCQFIQLQNDLQLSQAVNLLEPIMIAIMGLVMGATCVGLFLPIYSILGKFSG
ncbi:MAG: type II secretion system F family protein [Candidatus Eremiobacteraeota bacterium]|nr:type II secretion system F family protein [Candidatus Eremiobacteraeota bacterium]